MSYEAHLDMEVRKLRPAELYTLGNILNTSNSWKKLMSVVPKQGNVPKFTSEHISIIEQAARTDKRNAAQILLDEWSTMGRNRPTLKLLLELLVKAELFWAADYVACDILKQERPERPDYGPAASVDISDAAINQLLDNQVPPQNVFANSMGSTELISEIHRIEGPSEKFVAVQAAQSYRYEDQPNYQMNSELSSEELPVFLNNCK